MENLDQKDAELVNLGKKKHVIREKAVGFS